jgi:hypothetical protein
MSYKTIERFEATMSTPRLSNYPMQAENPLFGEESVHELARRLRAVSLIDPVDLLQRISAGVETPLPKFSVGSATDEPSLKRWDQIERATPEKLTLNQYQEFLEGKPPSAAEKEIDASLNVKDIRESIARISTVVVVLAIVALLNGISVALFSIEAFRSSMTQWYEIAAVATSCVGTLIGILWVFAQRRLFDKDRPDSHSAKRTWVRKTLR